MKEFMEYIADSPLLAHYAKFDIWFESGGLKGVEYKLDRNPPTLKLYPNHYFFGLCSRGVLVVLRVFSVLQARFGCL